MVRALRDPDGPNLDRIQIVKGWLGKDGETLERIFDVAVSGGRKIGPDGRCTTPVGSTVDVANASYSNTIGAPLLTAYWKDPEFDPTQHAFYYVRVIQIPTPRWTAYDQKRFGIKMADYVPMTVSIAPIPRPSGTRHETMAQRAARSFLVLGALMFGAYAWLHRGASGRSGQGAGPVRITAQGDRVPHGMAWGRLQQREPTARSCTPWWQGI